MADGQVRLRINYKNIFFKYVGILNVIEINVLIHLYETVKKKLQLFKVLLKSDAFCLPFRKFFNAGIEEILGQLGRPRADELLYLIVGVEPLTSKELSVVQTRGSHREINLDGRGGVLVPPTPIPRRA